MQSYWQLALQLQIIWNSLDMNHAFDLKGLFPKKHYMKTLVCPLSTVYGHHILEGGGSPRSCLFKVTPKSQPVKQCYHPRTSVCYSSRFDLRWQGHKDYPRTANADSGVLRRGTPTIGFGGVLYREERMPH